MKNTSHTLFREADSIVDEVVAKVGHVINLTTPLAIGKANHLINAFYRRAKSDSSIQLNIMTALTLERPKGKSLLEKRFLEPFVERVFGDYPDLDYELDRTSNALPSNIRVYEFYFPPGKFLGNAQAQQDYISSNYTHVVRDLMDRGANVVVQLITPHENQEGTTFSLGANPDVAVDLIRAMQQRHQRDGTPFAIAGQINPKLPYMYGDAEVRAGNFDYILDNPETYFRLFSTPKLSVPESDHMVGLYLSTLIKDEGELQVGIGAMGDALVNALVLRHRDNPNYTRVLRAIEVEGKFGDIINRLGETGPFEVGLFGATEMVVDGFLHLYEAGILKRQVYDDLPLQRLLNDGLITQEVTATTLERLLQRKAVHMYLSQADFDYLLRFGIFREGLEYHEGFIKTPQGQEIRADFTQEDNWNQVVEHCLGDHLKGGAVVHGGFFMGPQDFYQKLIAMPERERRLFSMRSVKRINHLYGHEEIDRLQRKNARFVNTCMKVTLAGHVISDGLEDGRVVSGVGGQYNFVSMAHELPDGRSLINLRSTRVEGGKVVSNIVENYGHTTIPRHLRDIVVTEYGIADLRGKSDSEIIEELLKITDSRFQAQLLHQARNSGKLRKDYEIPDPYRSNYPETITRMLAPFRQFFPPFPFGTDFSEEEQIVGKALKALKRKSGSKATMIGLLVKALFTRTVPDAQKPYLERMDLWQTTGFEERLFRNLLANELKDFVD